MYFALKTVEKDLLGSLPHPRYCYYLYIYVFCFLMDKLASMLSKYAIVSKYAIRKQVCHL